jgi:hypothetical protein
VGLGTAVGLSVQSAAGAEFARRLGSSLPAAAHVDPLVPDAIGRARAIDSNVFLSAVAWKQAVAAAQAQQQAEAEAPGPTATGGDSLFGESASVQATLACIREHESNGNYGAVNASSGAGGAYQFMPSTWASLGGSGLPENASAAEQDAMAVRLYEADGWSPWAGDACV